MAAGALLLDERNPGWHWNVKLDKLDLGNGYQCVLGQLYGFYGNGVRELYEQPYNDVYKPEGNAAPARHGFFSYNGYAGISALGANGENGGRYRYMTSLWSQEITKRRNRDVVEGRR